MVQVSKAEVTLWQCYSWRKLHVLRANIPTRISRIPGKSFCVCVNEWQWPFNYRQAWILISLRWQRMWHLFGHFHEKFSGKHSFRDEGCCHLTGMLHASPQVQSIRPVMFLSPWHMNGHCYLSCASSCHQFLESSSLWDTGAQHPWIKPLSVPMLLLTLQFPLGKPRHAAVWLLVF